MSLFAMIIKVVLIVLTIFLSQSAFSGTLTLRLAADYADPSGVQFHVLVNEEEIGTMMGEDLFAYQIGTEEEVFLRVYNLEKRIGGHINIVVPKDGKEAVFISIKSWLDKPVTGLFSAIYDHVLGLDFQKFTVRFYDEYHPDKLIRAKSIEDIYIENDALPNGRANLDELFQITAEGFVELKAIREFKNILTKTSGASMLNIDVLSIKHESMGDAVTFSIR